MAGFIAQSCVEQVRVASGIVEVIGAVVPLKKNGANFVGLCPFHKEKTPSFNVSPQKQFFYCYGCHMGGDVFKFLMAFENVDFGEAVTRLAERARIPIIYENRGGGNDDHFSEVKRSKDLLLQIHEEITQRWQSALANDAAGQIARDYLLKRAVHPDAVRLFRLGFAPDSWDDTVNWAKAKGFALETVEKAGLIIRNEKGGFYDRFRGRLIFPICDEQGRVIAFSARVLSGDEKTAKYVNSPETPIFTKGRIIYGLDKSKRGILDLQQAVVCEGQLDCIACFMAGITNVVAPQGTAFTSEHARILKRYGNEVVLCFDSDNAGQKATVRVLDDLLGSGLNIRVAKVPAPHDPDSYIKAHGSEAFRQIIASAEDFFDYYLNRLCATHDLDTDKGRSTVVRAMAEAVRKTSDHFLIDKYARKTAARMGVNPLNATAQFRALSKEPSHPAREKPDEAAAESAQPQPLQVSKDEAWFLKLLFLGEETLEWLEENLDLEWIPQPPLREIIALRLQRQAHGSYTDAASVSDRLQDDAVRQLLIQACMENREIPKRAEQIKDLVRRFRSNFLDLQLSRLTREAAQPNLSPEDELRIFTEQNRIRDMKRQKFG